MTEDERKAAERVITSQMRECLNSTDPGAQARWEALAAKLAELERDKP
jgi:hypothetical protein